MKYAFYPGCSLESTAWDFDKSVRTVCNALGVELEEIPDWVCCGSTPAHSSNASLAVALPALNLIKAKEMNLPAGSRNPGSHSHAIMFNGKGGLHPAILTKRSNLTLYY